MDLLHGKGKVQALVASLNASNHKEFFFYGESVQYVYTCKKKLFAFGVWNCHSKYNFMCK